MTSNTREGNFFWFVMEGLFSWKCPDTSLSCKVPSLTVGPTYFLTFFLFTLLLTLFLNLETVLTSLLGTPSLITGSPDFGRDSLTLYWGSPNTLLDKAQDLNSWGQKKNPSSSANKLEQKHEEIENKTKQWEPN